MSNRKRTFNLLVIAALSLAALVLIASVGEAEAPKASGQAPTSTSDKLLLVEIAQEAIRAQAEMTISGDFATALEGPHSASYRDLLFSTFRAKSVLPAAENEPKYTHYDATFLTKRVDTTAGGATVRLVERGILHYASDDRDPNAPTTHEYEYEHELRFLPDRGGWKLVSDRILNLPQPAKPVQPSMRLPEEATALPLGASLIEPGAAVEKAASVNRTAVANYALKYWSSYNSSYRTFSPTDCTNFVSQSVRAGGWTDVSGFYRDTRYWWYNFFNQTWTWVNAHNWGVFTYNRPRATMASYVSDLRVGDILEADFNADGTIDHAMVVTTKSGSSIYLTYHSNNTKNKPFSEILAGNKNAKWYAFKLSSTST